MEPIEVSVRELVLDTEPIEGVAGRKSAICADTEGVGKIQPTKVRARTLAFDAEPQESC
jgi:hypothetical protein